MKTLIVNSCNKKKINFLREQLNRLGYNPRFIDEEKFEDFILLESMLQNQKRAFVTEDKVIKALNR